jgi:hypothetical protein
MKQDIILPSGVAPSNLVLPNDTRTRMIDSDMYGICRRIAEVSRRLYVVVHEKPDGSLMHYSVMENCNDGVQRLALNVGPGRPIDALDARVIERLEYMQRIPLSKRLDAIEKMEEQDKIDEKERSLEELYEKMGRQMHWQLERDGFIDSRGISVPKKGIKPTKSAQI